jgi:nitrogen-specific signal transduction histidine kinase/CheY-like chemotaxis protein
MNESLRVLLVEDSEDDARLLLRKLRQGGYAPVFEQVDTAASFVRQLEERTWDIVLSDYSLPAFTALEALRLLKEQDLDLPFIIVSGAIGEETAVAAMKAGAHDYVMKDNLARLMPAIERELREVKGRRRRCQAEAALRESERENRRLSREFRTLLDNIPDSLTLLDADLNVIWANRGTARMLGRSLEGPTDGHCSQLWPECSARKENCPVRRSFQSGRPEVALVKAGLEKFWGVRAFPVLSKEGRVANVIKMVSDNSHQLLLKEEANRAAHLASLGELAAGVAHEINNPINGIINYAQILADQWAEHSDQQEIVGEIISEGERIALIVRNLLAFAKGQPEGKNPVAVEDILAAALALTKSQLAKDCIRLMVDMSPDLPPVLGHLQQIQQVVLNIISNARYALNQKYPGSHEDKIFHIQTQSKTVGKRSFVCLIFCDHGTGIPEGILHKIMDPFFSTKPNGAGTGLGLSISHGIVRDHDGRIEIDSVPGSHTRVMVDLPVHEV